MNFRTEIKIEPLTTTLGYEHRILALGSCFTEHISKRLADLKFAVTANPTGILFNPLSIARALERYADPKTICVNDLHEGAEGWFHYDFHSDFSASDAAVCCQKMNDGLRLGEEALRDADRVILTFGTAWVYEYEGEVVANCHKQPARCFTRRRLSVEEIVERFTNLFTGILNNKQIILTISPIRHLGDGLEENSLSKAILRVAVDELVGKFENVSYFPSYEILMDDLRDYRFYAPDMTHPSEQAIEYIWQKFREVAFTPETEELSQRIESVCLMLRHRPRNPQSEAHQKMLQKCRELMDEIKDVDFSREQAFLTESLKKN